MIVTVHRLDRRDRRSMRGGQAGAALRITMSGTARDGANVIAP